MNVNVLFLKNLIHIVSVVTKYIDLKTHVHVFKIAADEFVATFYLMAWLYTIVRLFAYNVSGFQKKEVNNFRLS